MKGSTRGSSRTGSSCVAFVADTGAFITGKVLALPPPIYTTPSVIDEVKDERSREILETAVSSGKVSVEEPDEAYIEEARSSAKVGGVLGRLSRADLEVLALALKLSGEGCRVYVVTDDYALQRAASKAGLEVVRLRYRGTVRA